MPDPRLPTAEETDTQVARLMAAPSRRATVRVDRFVYDRLTALARSFRAYDVALGSGADRDGGGAVVTAPDVDALRRAVEAIEPKARMTEWGGPVDIEWPAETHRADPKITVWPNGEIDAKNIRTARDRRILGAVLAWCDGEGG